MACNSVVEGGGGLLLKRGVQKAHHRKECQKPKGDAVQKANRTQTFGYKKYCCHHTTQDHNYLIT